MNTTADLTRTQRAALAALLTARVGLWPAGRGRWRLGNTTPWEARTLQALVDHGYAQWAPQHHGSMPYIVPTDKARTLR